MCLAGGVGASGQRLLLRRGQAGQARRVQAARCKDVLAPQRPVGGGRGGGEHRLRGGAEARRVPHVADGSTGPGEDVQQDVGGGAADEDRRGGGDRGPQARALLRAHRQAAGAAGGDQRTDAGGRGEHLPGGAGGGGETAERLLEVARAAHVRAVRPAARVCDGALRVLREDAQGHQGAEAQVEARHGRAGVCAGRGAGPAVRCQVLPGGVEADGTGSGGASAGGAEGAAGGGEVDVGGDEEKCVDEDEQVRGEDRLPRQVDRLLAADGHAGTTLRERTARARVPFQAPPLLHQRGD
eukprot:758713-Hanusia_phi.AAC.2